MTHPSAQPVARVTSSTAKPLARPRKKRSAPGWVPQAHGAWAMLLLPYLTGTVIRWQSGEIPAYIWPLLPTWLLGYFAYNALGLWLKSRRKPMYLRPLGVYAGLAALFGLLTLFAEPELLGWALVFAPLLGLGLWRAHLGDDASLLARGSAVVAACLVCAVVAAGPVDQAAALSPTHRALLATALLWGYFIGTLLYVKTMIRERGHAGFYALSVGYHLSLTLLLGWAAVRLTAAQGFGLGLPAFFALATLRAVLMPRLEHWTGRRTTPKQVGLLEFALSLVLLSVLGWG